MKFISIFCCNPVCTYVVGRADRLREGLKQAVYFQRESGTFAGR
ncbi:hypothetical protein [Paenibacillus sp. FSL H7-0326]|nr:hypothetical protein [Paenibacillus sp. FSL H7-0326]